MPTYAVSTRVNSNVSPDSILYDLCIYKMDPSKNKHVLLDVKQQQLQSNYETQLHTTHETSDALSVIYIMEVVLYWKTLLKITQVSQTPFRKMYTLHELNTGKAYSNVKRENPCFFVSTGTLRPASEGNNTTTINISRPERAFIAKEYPVGHVKDPFEKSKIEMQILERFNHSSYPIQGDGSLCGPAAFFYCLQKDRPDVYAQAARELWQYGKTTIGTLEIAPSDSCRHPASEFYTKNIARISGLDWMTLAGLRDSENSVLSYDSVNSPVAGVTMWDTLTEWFEKAGYEKVLSNAGITQIGIQGIRTLNEYISRGYKVVTLISDGLLDGSDSNLTVPTHWVVWDGQMTTSINGDVQLNIFSWGYVRNWIKSGKDVSFVISRLFGGMVFKPLK